MTHHPTDVHVGLRIRQRRALLGMSQTTLAKAVGLTFQQIQKYENGANRTGASRLYEFARVLDVPVSHFFDGLDASATKPKGRLPRHSKTADHPINTKRETLELVRAYYKIRQADVRDHMRRMIEALAKE